MREDWTYKKLGELGDIITGSTPSTKDSDNYSSNDYCFIKPSDLPSDGIGWISSSENHLSAKGYSISRKLPKGTVLVSCIGSIGKVGILEIEAASNQQINAIIPRSNINSVFLSYSICSIRDEMISKANAPVVPIINKSDFSNFQIAIPPIAEQERIVEELDLLSGIIEKKKEQLKAYDQLAQSIFYDMFGDPIDNPKGWEIKKLEDVVSSDCSISYGIVQPGEDLSDGVPVVRPVDLTDTWVSRKGLKKVDKSISDAYRRTILKGNELLFCVRGTTGVISFATGELHGCNVTRGITPLSFDDHINSFYIFHLIKTDGLQSIISERTRGIALKQINMKDVRLLPIMVPPLSLQQEFAKKIEAIEQQKALIQQSIAETQTLFDCTMDKYFG